MMEKDGMNGTNEINDRKEIRQNENSKTNAPQNNNLQWSPLVKRKRESIKNVRKQNRVKIPRIKRPTNRQ